jgi:hypothetical protein
MPNKLKLLKVKDKTDKHTKKFDLLMDLPLRMLISGNSGSGKTNFAVNMCLNKNYPYSSIFSGEDIYILSPTPYSDFKLNLIIEEKEIPEENIFDELDDDILNDLYENLIEEYKEAKREKEEPKHKLILIDDFGFSGGMSNRRFNTVSKIFCNGRKFLISSMVLLQKYTQATSNIRSNCSCMVIFNTSNSELEQIEKENNYLKTKKDFVNMFRDNLKEKHDCLIINYSNDFKNLYLDKNFEKLINN